MATIVHKTINGHGPYAYRVTYVGGGKQNWEYLGKVGGGVPSEGPVTNTGTEGALSDSEIEAIEDALEQGAGGNSPHLLEKVEEILENPPEKFSDLTEEQADALVQVLGLVHSLDSYTKHEKTDDLIEKAQERVANAQESGTEDVPTGREKFEEDRLMRMGDEELNRLESDLVNNGIEFDQEVTDQERLDFITKIKEQRTKRSLTDTDTWSEPSIDGGENDKQQLKKIDGVGEQLASEMIEKLGDAYTVYRHGTEFADHVEGVSVDRMREIREELRDMGIKRHPKSPPGRAWKRAEEDDGPDAVLGGDGVVGGDEL